jgi:hypothetical protein
MSKDPLPPSLKQSVILSEAVRRLSRKIPSRQALEQSVILSEAVRRLSRKIPSRQALAFPVGILRLGASEAPRSEWQVIRPRFPGWDPSSRRSGRFARDDRFFGL